MNFQPVTACYPFEAYVHSAALFIGLLALTAIVVGFLYLGAYRNEN